MTSTTRPRPSIPGGLVADITAPFGRLEALAYDTAVAPAVTDVAAAFEHEFLAQVPEEGTILDVGCGGGQIAIHIADVRSDLRVTGVDLSLDQIARARRRARHLGDRASFIEGSALDLPFGDAGFDAILSVASLKHWPDQALGLRECVRVLRSGGLLLVAEVDRGCRFEDAQDFVAASRFPWPLTVLALPVFRTFVAGRSLDLDEARELADGLAVADLSVSRLPGIPALQIRGRRI